MSYSPYFKRVEEGDTIQDELYDALDELNTNKLKRYNPLLTKLADGAFYFKEFSDERLKYKIWINDNRFWFYHRANGLSKTGYVFNGSSHTLMTITDGLVTMLDMIT
jgi:hypothetical protein